MNKMDELKKAYKALQAKEVPDLWPRIEAALEEKREEASDFQQTETLFGIVEKESQKRAGREKEKFWRGGRIPVRTAAACCVIFIVGALSINGIRIIRRWEEESSHSDYAIMRDGEMAVCSETMAAPREGNEKAEKGGLEAGEIENIQMEAGEGIVAEETTGEDGEEEKIVSYEDLALSGTWIWPLEGEGDNTAALDPPFVEEKAGETDLLVQAEITNVSYGETEEGIIDEAIYELETRQILYSEGYWKQGETIQVKSPLLWDQDKKRFVYGLKQGGNYILPLKEEKGEWELVFPFAPQIEVTEDKKYLFHRGWKSLLNEKTAVVRMESCEIENSGQEGSYQDSLVLREDPEFLKELTALVR